MLIMSFPEDFLGGLHGAVIRLGIHINSMIYNLVNFLFDIFNAVISAKIFTRTDFERVANSIYLVIGVVALFIIAYALLRAIIDPDSAAKGNYSVKKIVPNILISIALIAFVPTIFNNAYKLQDGIISSNVIPNVILGMNVNGDSHNYLYSNGREMTNSVFISFFVPTQDVNGSISDYFDDLKINECWLFYCPDSRDYSMKDAMNDVADPENGKGFGVYAEFSDYMHGKDEAKNKIEYNFLLQLIAGCFLVYVLANICIDMAVRTVKLGYFQIIAPIPILTLMLPGQKKIFDNWLKNTISTFMDVFIRIAVIFFGIFLINHLPDMGSDFWKDQLSGPNHPIWAKAFIIVGILIFMKQAPKLITDIFGIASGSFKLGIKDKLGEMAFVGDKAKDMITKAEGLGNNLRGAASGALGAGLTSKINGTGWKNGMKFGFSRGWKNGKNNPHQFSSMHQSFYSDAMEGEGKAAWFGKGRAKFDKMGAQWEKDAKNAYKEQNFNRVRDYQNSTEWKALYNSRYDAKTAELENNKKAAEDEIQNITKQYEIEKSEKIHEISSAKAHMQTIQTNERLRDMEIKSFEAEKQKKIDELKNLYETATELGDVSQQNYIKLQMDAIKDQKYSNPELEKKIADLKDSMPDISKLEEELHQIEVNGNNDKRLIEKQNIIDSSTKELKALELEKAYLDDENRTYKMEREFYKDHGFSDLYTGVNELFKEGDPNINLPANPDFKDVYDTNMKNLTKEQVTKYMTSLEGQKQIATFQQAQKNLQGSGGGADKSDAKK